MLLVEIKNLNYDNIMKDVQWLYSTTNNFILLVHKLLLHRFLLQGIIFQVQYIRRLGGTYQGHLAL